MHRYTPACMPQLPHATLAPTPPQPPSLPLSYPFFPDPLQVVTSTVRAFPTVAIWPLVLWAVLTGCGLFGVIYGANLASNAARSNTMVEAGRTADNFGLVLQQVRILQDVGATDCM